MASTSADGRDRITRREGRVLTMYQDSAGLPTIGVGHLLTKDEIRSGKLTHPPVRWTEGISHDLADELLHFDLATAEEAVERGVRVPLSPQQFDTLVSFVFNVGTGAFQRSRLLHVLNLGDYEAVPRQLERWIYSAGRVDPILVKRREDEIRQWKESTA